MSTRRAWYTGLVLVFAAVAAPACTAPPGGSPAPSASASAAPASVAVLVVDDFDGQPAAPPPGNANLANIDCAYTGQSTQDVGSKGASGGSLPAGVAHGAVVYDELRSELDQRPSKHVTPPATSYGDYGLDPAYVRDLDVWTAGSTEVALVGVDVAQYETGRLTTEISGVVSAMRAAKLHPFAQFVLNMSFVVAPCDVQPYVSGTTDLVDAYRMLIDSQPELNGFKDALDALTQGAVSPKQMRANLIASPDLLPLTNDLTDPAKFAELSEAVRLRLFYGLFERGGRLDQAGDFFPSTVFRQLLDDPLNTWLANTASYVVPVAAAGNGLGYQPTADPALPAGDGEVVKIRLDFPFAPAIWDSVVSVSATETDPHAAVADPRARYSNGGEVMLDGRYTYQGSDVRGTSFAAPRLSYLEALYLVGGGTVPCGQAVPPLGYADLDRWDNLGVAAAAARSGCVGFPPGP